MEIEKRIAPDNVHFEIVAPLQMRSRIRQALGVNYDLDGSNSPVLDYSVGHKSFHVLSCDDISVFDTVYLALLKLSIGNYLGQTL